MIYQKKKVTYFSNKNTITLMKTKKRKKVDWAQIIYISLCSELDWWYKYVKENKGDKKDTCQLVLILAKIFKYLFVHQKENPQKPQVKVKKTREEMQATLENRRKAIIESARCAFKRKNKVKQGGASGLGVKKKQEGTKDDEGENGTIYSANISTSRQAECASTTYVIST